MAEILSLIAVVFMLVLFRVLDKKYDDGAVIQFYKKRGVIK